MKATYNPRQYPAAERLKATAFCIKVSCDAMLEVPKEWECLVDSSEDFFEDVFESLSEAGGIMPVGKLLAAGPMVEAPKELQRHMKEAMSVLEGLVKDSRRAADLPAEMLFTKLYNECLFADSSKEEKKAK